MDIGKKATQQDDPWLLALDREYVNKLCFLDDISLRHKLYRICLIAFLAEHKNTLCQLGRHNGTCAYS